jgi:regulator of RNase E activity RraA
LAIIPADQVEDGIQKSIEREAKEDATKERLRTGETSLDIYGWDKG